MKMRIYIWVDTCDRQVKGYYYSIKALRKALIEYYKELLKEDPTDKEISTIIKELKNPEVKDTYDLEMTCADTDIILDFIDIDLQSK